MLKECILPDKMKCELMIIGGGISGMTAALFAADSGIKTSLVGMTSELGFASGLIDIMGVYPISEGKVCDNPFDLIETISKEIPSHPLAKISVTNIHKSLDIFLNFLNMNGLSYFRDNYKNQLAITSLGTSKPSYGIPGSMIEGVKAYKEKKPCLIIDIHNMKGFSAKQIAGTLRKQWADISTETISFPDAKGEVFGENIALFLENPVILKQFAVNILPHIKENKVVGLPAVLGIDKTAQVKKSLEDYLKVPVFEIPMLPPSVPGIRIKNVFESALPKKGVTLLRQKKVLEAGSTGSGKLIFRVGCETQGKKITIEANAAILATGRFIGKGLKADYNAIRETVFNLPVAQPENRHKWHSKDFFDKEGHPINNAGIEIDNYFRPVNSENKPILNNLFAIGSILAHNDWKRMKSGSGVSIASAYAAVNSYLKLKNNR